MAAPTLVLRVTLGQAMPKDGDLRGERVNIGRQPMVADANGRVVRRNDIAFVGDDEVSRSVSRAHAPSRGSRRRARIACSTSRARTGRWSRAADRLIQVPPGRDGLKLAAGDEVHVGRAVVVVGIPSAP